MTDRTMKVKSVFGDPEIYEHLHHLGLFTLEELYEYLQLQFGGADREHVNEAFRRTLRPGQVDLIHHVVTQFELDRYGPHRGDVDFENPETNEGDWGFDCELYGVKTHPGIPFSGEEPARLATVEALEDLKGELTRLVWFQAIAVTVLGALAIASLWLGV